MTSYLSLLAIIAPIFIFIAVGIVARRLDWLTAEADTSILKLVVNVLYPCLIFQSVFGGIFSR